MTIARAPMRIGIAGGGTDLPSYYRRFGGRCLTLAVDLYVTVSILPDQPWFSPATDPFVAKALAAYGFEGRRVEVLRDAPHGCGLGASGALLVALAAATQETRDQTYCAEAAFMAETRGMGMCVGKQDQYAAAFGGLNMFTFAEDGCCSVEPVHDSDARALCEHLLLIYAGGRHTASDVLNGQRRRTESDDPDTLDGLRRCKRSAESAWGYVIRREWNMLGHVFAEQWERKRATSPLATTPELETKLGAVLAAGAYGAKVCGAGGGGFIVAACENAAEVQKRLEVSGMPTRTVSPSRGGVRLINV